MPQDKNKPNQGRGSNDPSQNTGGNSVAEEIDWLILSDLGTSDREKFKNSANDPLQNLNEMLSDDQEDIDWLQSIGLDEPVTGIKSHNPSDSELPQSANQKATASTVGDIDWLIVTDLKTRMGDTDLKLKNQELAPPLPTQTESLDFSLPTFSDEPDDTLPDLLEGILAQSDLGLGDLSDFKDLSSADSPFDLDLELEGLSIDDRVSDLDLETELTAFNLDRNADPNHDALDPLVSNSLDLDLDAGNEWNDDLSGDLLEQLNLGDRSLEANQDVASDNLDFDLDLDFGGELQAEISGSDEAFSDDAFPSLTESSSEDFGNLGLDLGFDEELSLEEEPIVEELSSLEQGNTLESNFELGFEDELQAAFPTDDADLHLLDESISLAPDPLVHSDPLGHDAIASEAIPPDPLADLLLADSLDDALDVASFDAENVFDPMSDAIAPLVPAILSEMHTAATSADDWLIPASLEPSSQVDENLDLGGMDDFGAWDSTTSTPDLSATGMDDDWASTPSLDAQPMSSSDLGDSDLDAPELTPSQVDDFATWDSGTIATDMSGGMEDLGMEAMPVDAFDLDDDWASTPSLDSQPSPEDSGLNTSADLDAPELTPSADDFATWDSETVADISADRSPSIDLMGMELEDPYTELLTNDDFDAQLEQGLEDLDAEALEQFENEFEAQLDDGLDVGIDAIEASQMSPLDELDLNQLELDRLDVDRLELDAQNQQELLDKELEEFISDTAGEIGNEFGHDLEPQTQEDLLAEDLMPLYENQFENLATDQSPEQYPDLTYAYTNPSTTWDITENDLLPTPQYGSVLQDDLDDDLTSLNAGLEFQDGFEAGIDSLTDARFQAQPEPQFEVPVSDSLTEFEFSDAIAEHDLVEQESFDAHAFAYPIEGHIEERTDGGIELPPDATAMLPADIIGVINDLEDLAIDKDDFDGFNTFDTLEIDNDFGTFESVNIDDSTFNELGFKATTFDYLDDDDDDTDALANSLQDASRRGGLPTPKDDFDDDDITDLRFAANQLAGIDNRASQAIANPPITPPPPPVKASQAFIPAPPAIASQSAQNFDDDRMIASIETRNSDFLDDFDLDSVDSDFLSKNSPFTSSDGMDDFETSALPPVQSSFRQPAQPTSQPNDEVEEMDLTDLKDSSYNMIFPMPLPPLPSRKSSTPKDPSKLNPPASSSQISGGTRRTASNTSGKTSSTGNTSPPKTTSSLPSLPFDVEEEWSGLLENDPQTDDSLFSSANFSTVDRNRVSSLNPPSPPPARTSTPTSNSQGAGSQSSKASSGANNPSRQKPKDARVLPLPNLDDLDSFTAGSDSDDWTGLLDMNTEISSVKPAADRYRSPIDAMATDMDTRESSRRSPQPTMSGFSENTRSAQLASRMDTNTLPSQRSLPRVEDQAPPAKLKRQAPTIDFETLWNKYLKFPLIGLSAIGLLYVGFVFLQRPVVELALRMQLLKDVNGRDFSGSNFKDFKLDEVNFSKANLSNVNLEGASLKGANLVEANLEGATFTKANLKGARLIKANLVASKLQNAQLPFADLKGADLTRSNFLGANLEGASLAETKIGKGADKAKLESKDFLMWQIVNEPRAGRNLATLNLSGFNLNSANLVKANLTEAKLSWADLTGANLTSANLTGATLNGSNLSGANLKGADFTDIRIEPDKPVQTNEETICPNGSKGPCKF